MGTVSMRSGFFVLKQVRKNSTLSHGTGFFQPNAPINSSILEPIAEVPVQLGPTIGAVYENMR